MRRDWVSLALPVDGLVFLCFFVVVVSMVPWWCCVSTGRDLRPRARLCKHHRNPRVCVCVCVCVMLFRRGRGGDGRLGRQSFAADALEGAVPAGARQEPQGSRGT